MRFTEHELTSALHGAAKRVLAAERSVRRRKGDRDAAVEAAWAELDRFRRFQLLDALGSQILPVLVALPDIEVAPGTRASYTPAEVEAVVTELVADEGGRLRRAALIKARTSLVITALEHLPVRRDPDALLSPEDDDLPAVPDDPSGLL
ncbi:hypothetical protein [Nocardioides sp.]|uniref:hypothetical protein n=1 Tax=Nocardioides sp. TaxID=35761 RepID=UPI003514D8DB